MESVFQPAPYGGVNELVPVSEINSPNCEELLNFNVDQGGISLRNGDSIYAHFTGTANSAPLGLFAYGETDKLYAALYRISDGKIDFVDCSDGSLDYTTTTATTSILRSVVFNKRLFIYGDDTTSAPGWNFDGVNWAVTTYTGSGMYPTGGNVFNHRQYLVQRQDASYWYTGIDQVSGACFFKDLNGLTQNKTTLASIGAFTHVSSYGVSTVYQCFVMANGEVLFFTGGYPDSDDWTIVGTANISQTITYTAVIPYQGDTLLITDSGLVSLRSLFLSLRDVSVTSSEESPSLTMSAFAQRTWVSYIQAYRNLYGLPVGPLPPTYISGRVRGVFDKKNNRIVIFFPNYLDSSGVLQVGAFYFIYDNFQKAWFFHQNASQKVFDVAVFENSVKVLGYSGIASTTFYILTKEGSTDFLDTAYITGGSTLASGYDFEMISAPVPFRKDAVYTINGIEPLIESDLYAETNWKLIADFGRQETAAQPLGTDVLTTSIQKPQVNIGITANFAQVKMYGTTVTGKTVGLTLSGFNVWYESGEKGSR
jgi:hypothetical protein